MGFSLYLLSVSPPIPVPGDHSRVLQVGASDILECKVNGPDNHATVQWVKPDGSVLHLNKVNLNSVAISDKGIWQCKVSQEEATFTKNITIQIKGMMFSLKYKGITVNLHQKFFLHTFAFQNLIQNQQLLR